MDSDLVPTVAGYAESVLGQEGFRYASSGVATCKMLALELEVQEDKEVESLSTDAMIIAAYLHNISTIESGFLDHHTRSAQMAVEFLQKNDAKAELVKQVEQILLAHTTVLPPDKRSTLPLAARIIYDADKLGRLSGLAVVTSLIEFGARYPDRVVNGEVLANVLKHIEERFVELYTSLNTEPARDMARAKFGNTLAFLDGVIEHLSDATPV
jgi:hypothetical protein